MMRASRIAIVAFAALAAGMTNLSHAAGSGEDPLSNENVPFAPPDYGAAKQSFEKMSPGDRATLQVVMTALGCWTTSPTQSFNQALFAAIQDCQSRNGLKADGNPSENTTRTLIGRSKPQFRTWGFRAVYLSAKKKDFVWVPFGIDGTLVLEDEGASYATAGDKIFESLFQFANKSARQSYQDFLEIFEREKRAGKTQITIVTSISKPDGFIIRANRSRQDGRNEKVYIRGQQVDAGILGFAFTWDSDDADLQGERAALLISDSFAASHYHLEFIRPPSQHDLMDDAE